MEELLVNMTKKARLECEESHRQYVFANNALAALDLINNKVRKSTGCRKWPSPLLKTAWFTFKCCLTLDIKYKLIRN